MSIPRGTTPINYFTVPIDLSDAAVVYLTYAQNGKTVVEKEKEDITFTAEDETYEMSVQLTQVDTLAFCDKSPVDMQIRRDAGKPGTVHGRFSVFADRG